MGTPLNVLAKDCKDGGNGLQARRVPATYIVVCDAYIGLSFVTRCIGKGRLYWKRLLGFERILPAAAMPDVLVFL